MSAVDAWPITVTIDTVICCHEGCDAVIAMPADVMKKFRKTHEGFYCYRGHEQWFLGETKEERLKKKLEQTEKRLQWAADEARKERARAERIDNSRRAYKGQITKIKRRIGRGVCPCCNRSFENLKRHMDTKHPDYKDPA